MRSCHLRSRSKPQSRNIYQQFAVHSTLTGQVQAFCRGPKLPPDHCLLYWLLHHHNSPLLRDAQAFRLCISDSSNTQSPQQLGLLLHTPHSGELPLGDELTARPSQNQVGSQAELCCFTDQPNRYSCVLCSYGASSLDPQQSYTSNALLICSKTSTPPTTKSESKHTLYVPATLLPYCSHL